MRALRSYGTGDIIYVIIFLNSHVNLRLASFVYAMNQKLEKA